MIKMQTAVRKLVENAWDLDVFKLAYDTSLTIHRATKSFPKEELFGLTNQIRRCSKSICANIAEGFAKQFVSSAEFKRFISIALGSAAEMQVWTSYCLDLQYIDKQDATQWKNNYASVSRMLGKLYANIT
jgi:four helix bundle protein